jgi:hypothetical protein
MQAIAHMDRLNSKRLEMAQDVRQRRRTSACFCPTDVVSKGGRGGIGPESGINIDI